jgi:hypothetical protein
LEPKAQFVEEISNAEELTVAWIGVFPDLASYR